MYSPNIRSKVWTRVPGPSQFDRKTLRIASTSASPKLGWKRLIIPLEEFGRSHDRAAQVGDQFVRDDTPPVAEPKDILFKFAVPIDQINERPWLGDDPMR